MESENTSNQKASFDPGWNDPPTFSYNTQQTQPVRPRNFLNKRVAFPLSGGNTNNVQPSGNIPPIPTAIPPTSPPQINSKSIHLSDEEISHDSESMLNEVKNILLQLLDSSSELGSKSSDIKRKISVMEEMWKARKLNGQVQLQMKNLAYALKEDQPKKADEIHRALMVDHVASVGTWMPGIKQLVHHSIARTELIAIDHDS